MNTMSLAAAIWAVLAICVVSLIFYRRTLTSHEDDSVHLEHETGKTSEQMVLAGKIDSVDKWGKLLTIITVIYGIALLAYWVYTTTVGNVTRGL